MDDERQRIIEELLAMNGRAAALGEYETAYHTVTGALHLADHARDPAALDRIAEIVTRQDADIEKIRPAHHLSSAQATERGQTALFASLQVHIEAVRLRIQADRQRERAAAAR